MRGLGRKVGFLGLRSGSLYVVWHLLPFAIVVCRSAQFYGSFHSMKILIERGMTHLSGMACTKPPSAVNMAPADDPSFPTGVSTVLRKLRGIPVTRT